MDVDSKLFTGKSFMINCKEQFFASFWKPLYLNHQCTYYDIFNTPIKLLQSFLYVEVTVVYIKVDIDLYIRPKWFEK